MKSVSYPPGSDLIPSELGPTTTGVSFPSLLRRSRMARVFSSASLPVSVSPMPPGIRITLWAASQEVMWSITSGTLGAETATTIRFAFHGSLATSSTHSTPSMVSASGRTTLIFEGSKPSRKMLRRIVRPTLVPLADTPTMAIVSG